MSRRPGPKPVWICLVFLGRSKFLCRFARPEICFSQTYCLADRKLVSTACAKKSADPAWRGIIRHQPSNQQINYSSACYHGSHGIPESSFQLLILRETTPSPAELFQAFRPALPSPPGPVAVDRISWHGLVWKWVTCTPIIYCHLDEQIWDIDDTPWNLEVPYFQTDQPTCFIMFPTCSNVTVHIIEEYCTFTPWHTKNFRRVLPWARRDVCQGVKPLKNNCACRRSWSVALWLTLQNNIFRWLQISKSVFECFWSIHIHTDFPFAESEKRRPRRFRPVAVKAGSSCTSATATSGQKKWGKFSWRS